MEDLKQHYLDELQRLSNLKYRDEIKIAELKENFNGMSIKIRKKEKLLQEEQWAYLSTHPSKRLTSFCFNDDDDDEDYTFAITPDELILSIEEPNNSLIMGDEHLDTIPATETDEFIKFGVETLIPIPSESEGIPEHVCDVPFHDNSPPLNVLKDQIEDFSDSNEEFSLTDDDSYSLDNIDYVEASPLDSELVSSETKSSSTYLNSLLEETNNFDNFLPEFTTLSKVPFDAECESGSSDDQSSSDEDILKKIISKPLSEEEIIHMESLRTHDSSLPISSKINSLLNEFAGELTLLKSISPGIDESDCDFEEDIRLIEKLLYDNSSPRPPKEFVSANSDAASESFSPSPILVKDSDSLMEEMDLFCTPDYPMPSGIVDEDYDSERDILIPKDFPRNNSLSFAEKESFHFDIPPFSPPPAKPPDDDTGILNIKMMGDQKAFMHKLMITLASHQEKSPDLLSHRCGTVKKFNTHRSQLNECPMLIHGQNNPLLDVLLIDSLLDEFASELTLLKSIPSGIDETDCDFEEDIRLIEKLLYDNSSPRPPEKFVSVNSDAKIKSFSPSPILVKDSDSLIEEIDLFCTPNYPMSSSIEDKDYDSERDILIRKDLPRNNTLSFAPKIENFKIFKCF
nr:hypothetical protein [Tanacetum cinerariifolium]